MKHNVSVVLARAVISQLSYDTFPPECKTNITSMIFYGRKLSSGPYRTSGSPNNSVVKFRGTIKAEKDPTFARVPRREGSREATH